MKKMILKSALLAITGVSLIAGNAAADEITLQAALDIRTEGGISSVNVATDMIDDSLDSAWQITASASSVATLLFEITSHSNTNTFGIYDLNDNTKRVELFSGSDNAANPTQQTPGATVTLHTYGTKFYTDNFATAVEFSSDSFGYYLFNEDDTEIFYSDSTLRNDGFDYMRAYQGTGDQFSVFNTDTYRTWTDNEYILAWEDWAGGGDKDWQDFVVMVESVETAPVPEPATMLLFGTGLAGLAGLRRKKSKKA